MTIDLQTLLNDLMQPPRIPRATYRLQFNQDFTFEDAQALVPYLDSLGISDIYASPLFKPRSASTHGYDTVDYNQFNPKLGTDEDFEALVSTLHQHEMGLLLDIVPNHMGVSTENVWWTDVLKEGLTSEYAHYFDIDWRPQNRYLDDKVLLPVLGDHYGRVLEAGELQVVYWHGDFYIHYYEHQFPLTPESYGKILHHVLAKLSEVDDLEDWVAMETASVIHSLTYLPSYRSQDDDEIIARRREQVIVRWRLLGLFDKSEAFRTVLQTTLEEINGNPDDPTSYDTLDDLLNDQPFRLAYWRVATDEINYRRFFDINDMAAIRIEDPQVFADVHRLSLQLLATGKVNGLRIDHPDGLWDPETYFWRLQAAYLEAAVKHHLGDDHEIPAEVTARLRFLRKSQPERAEWPLYVLVEKILSETEPLPFSWAVHGTTGYDFMYTVNNLFVNITNQGAFDEIYADFIGEAMDFHELTAYTQHLVMSQSLTSEIDARSTELARIVEQNRRYRGFTQNSLAFGLGEVISALNIYRTYITGPARVSERDRQYVQEAVDEAKRRNRLVPSSIFDFLRDTLLMQNFEDFAKEHRANLREFVMKFQQITGPVMAKSVEDTAFYIYNRLVSLNEVGGHPDRFGITVDEFHEHNTQKAYPHTMLSTSTHDTKRSEDVRARLNVLSDMPDEWHEAVQHWASLNADAKTTVSDEDAPSANDEYLIYQTLLGAYDHNAADAPDTFLQRIVGYMHKAINEAKTHSNWINPNNEYAQAIADFVTTIWSSDAFREAFDPFYQRVAFFGRFNSLAQVLLKLTSPGVPDIYQGNELWDYSLVDPDNRRPVDFDRRQTLLNDMQSVAEADRLGFAHSLVEDMPSGAIKLYVIYRTLAYRRAHQVLFESGKYIPVKVEGPQSAHVCAFIRKDEHATALVMVPRLIVTLTQGREMPPVGEDIWQGTQIVLPESLVIDRFENILTGEQVTVGQEGLRRVIPLAQALSVFPVGFLNGLATE